MGLMVDPLIIFVIIVAVLYGVVIIIERTERRLEQRQIK